MADILGQLGTASDDAWSSLPADLAYALLTLGATDGEVAEMLGKTRMARRRKRAKVSPGMGILDEKLLVRLDKLLGKRSHGSTPSRTLTSP